MGREWLRLAAPEPTPRPIPAHADPLLDTGGWAGAAFEAECSRVRTAPEGTRNDTLNTSAFNLGQLIPGGWLDEAQVRRGLTAAALECGLDFSGAAATINSGLAAGMEHPRGPKERSDGPVSDQEGEGAVGRPDTDWEALWADTGVMEWLCEPIVPAGRLVALYSPPGVGKSLLALELAVAISRGTHALGVKCKRTTVLYLDYEMVDLDVRDRLISMGLEPADLDNLRYQPFCDLPPLNTVAGGQALLAMALDRGAGLVVIDTISRAIVGEENDASTWLALYRCTLAPLKAAGIAVLRLDHTGKDEERGMRGSSAKIGDVDLIWRLEEIAKGDAYLLKCDKQRIRIRETLINIERRNDPLAHHVDMRSVTEVRKDAVLKALDDAGLPIEAGRVQARAALKAAGIKIRESTLADLIKARQHPDGLPDE